MALELASFSGQCEREGCGGRNEIIFHFVLFVVTALGGGIFSGGQQWSRIRVPVTLPPDDPMCVCVCCNVMLLMTGGSIKLFINLK